MARSRKPVGRASHSTLGYDWVGLREEYLSRRMSGEKISLSEFYREATARVRAAGGHTTSLKYWQRCTLGWLDELAKREARADEAMAKAMVVDHMAQRREILALAPRIRAILDSALRIYSEELDSQLGLPREQRRPVELADLKLLAELEVSVRRVGSGLPQVHEVVGKVVHEERAPEAAALAEAGRSFRAHMLARGHALPEPQGPVN